MGAVVCARIKVSTLVCASSEGGTTWRVIAHLNVTIEACRSARCASCPWDRLPSCCHEQASSWSGGAVEQA